MRHLKRLFSERVLDERFINFFPNTQLSKVIGFIGPRGSMKSLSASAMTIIDYLVPGYNVWSNMNINWGVDYLGQKLLYNTQDLNKHKMMNFNLSNGLVFIDEINLEFSEARRSMTKQNLTFNKLLQQIRKKQINLIYTVQSELWIDNRLRWQTDIFIKCEDTRMRAGGNRLPYEFGEIGVWTVFDMSGMLGAGSYYHTQRPVKTFKFYGKQWWNTFDTFETQADRLEYGKVENPEIESNYTEEELQLLEATQKVVTAYVESEVSEAYEDELVDLINEKTDFEVYGYQDVIRDLILQMTKYDRTTWSNGRRVHRFERLIKQKERDLVTV